MTSQLPRMEGIGAEELMDLAASNGELEGEGYQQFLDVEAKGIEKKLGFLPPSQVLFLRQTREHYDREPLVDLSYSIESNGQAMPCLIAWCTSKESAQAYLDGLNEYKGSNYSLEDEHVIASTHNGYEGDYLILIAGHRRTLSSIIKNYRKSENDGLEPDPDYEPLEVKMYKDISFDDGIELQLTENIREEIPPHEEAIGIAIAYERQMDRRKMTQKSFARTIGIGSDKLRRALRFRSLPKEVHSLVAGDHAALEYAREQKGVLDGWENPRPLGYLASVELAKLKGQNALHQLYTDKEIVEWALIATKEKWSLDTAVERVNQLVAKRELPEELEDYVDASNMGTEYAEIISRLKDYYTPEKMLLLLQQCDAQEWDRFEFSKRVNTMVDEARHGAFQLFTGTDLDALESVKAIETSEAARTAKALGDIARITDLLRHGYVDVQALLRSKDVLAGLVELADALEADQVDTDTTERLRGAAKYAAQIASGQTDLVLDPIVGPERLPQDEPEQPLFQ